MNNNFFPLLKLYNNLFKTKKLHS